MKTKEFLQIAILYSAFFALLLFIILTTKYALREKAAGLLILTVYVGGLILFVRETKKEKSAEVKA